MANIQGGDLCRVSSLVIRERKTKMLLIIYFLFTRSQRAIATRSDPGTRCANRLLDSVHATAATEICRAANAITDTTSFPHALVTSLLLLLFSKRFPATRQCRSFSVRRLQLRFDRIGAGSVQQEQRTVHMQRRVRRAQVRQVSGRLQRVSRLQAVRLFGTGKRDGRVRRVGQVPVSTEFRRQNVRTV